LFGKKTNNLLLTSRGTYWFMSRVTDESVLQPLSTMSIGSSLVKTEISLLSHLEKVAVE